MVEALAQCGRLGLEPLATWLPTPRKVQILFALLMRTAFKEPRSFLLHRCSHCMQCRGIYAECSACKDSWKVQGLTGGALGIDPIELNRATLVVLWGFNHR